MPTVRRIVGEAADDDYKFSALVLGVVRSEQFRMRRVPATAPLEIAESDRNSL
jgi:hypothetical protein